jgi:hypothetical protein
MPLFFAGDIGLCRELATQEARHWRPFVNRHWNGALTHMWNGPGCKIFLWLNKG